jgi:hypothetical protein
LWRTEGQSRRCADGQWAGVWDLECLTDDGCVGDVGGEEDQASTDEKGKANLGREPRRRPVTRTPSRGRIRLRGRRHAVRLFRRHPASRRPRGRPEAGRVGICGGWHASERVALPAGSGRRGDVRPTASVERSSGNPSLGDEDASHRQRQGVNRRRPAVHRRGDLLSPDDLLVRAVLSAFEGVLAPVP